MAENKKSFVLYTDLIKVVEQLPDEIAGKLFKIVLRYVNDLEVNVDDLLLKVAFEPIKLQLKRDLEKYEVVKEKRSLAGKKSAEIKKQNSTNSTHVDFVQQTSTNSTDNDNVNDTVNDTDTVINNILLKKESKDKNFDFKKNLIENGFDEKLVIDWLKVRKTKKATNTETAFKKFINEVEKSNREKNEVLKICIEKDWKGFHHDWLKNIPAYFRMLNNTQTNGNLIHTN